MAIWTRRSAGGNPTTRRVVGERGPTWPGVSTSRRARGSAIARVGSCSSLRPSVSLLLAPASAVIVGLGAQPASALSDWSANGVVVTASGTGVPGISIGVDGCLGSPGGCASDVTNSSGDFTLQSTGPIGQVSIHVLGSPYPLTDFSVTACPGRVSQPGVCTMQELTDGSGPWTVNFLFTGQLATTITGTLTNDAGDPVSGVTVGAAPEAGWSDGGLRGLREHGCLHHYGGPRRLHGRAIGVGVRHEA